MRRLILGIVILMAVPAYALGQQRDRSERSATGRTAVPRAEAVQGTPATGTERRAQPRGETRTPVPPDEQSADSAAARAGRERGSTPDAAVTGRGHSRDERPRAAPARTYRAHPPRVPGGPAPIAPPNHGLRPFPDREHPHPPRYRRPHSGANVVFVPYAAPVVVERQVVVEREVVDVAAGAPVIVEPPSVARLILDVHPPTAQVFADGYYIGIPEDFRFNEGGAVLEPGPHRIDIIARDYEPVSFDVNLTRGQTATFRHILTPIAAAPQPEPDATVKSPPAAKGPATFYLIPGCYMGNVPPRKANLPATCDIARAVSVQY